MTKLLSSSLLLPFLLFSSFSFAQYTIYCTVDAASDLNITTTEETSFAAVRLGWVNECGSTILAPKTVYWHLYSLPDDAVAKISMSPPGLVTPQVKDGTLQFAVRDLSNDGYSMSDNVQAGVAIWLPAAQMRSVFLAGVDEIVEVVYNGTESLTISNTGIDNKIFITSPHAPVQYRSTGVDTSAEIQAGAGGSSVHLTGVDAKVAIAVPDDTLTVRVDMAGVDGTVSIDGGYQSISLSGVDPKVYVSTNCDGVSKSGVDAECIVTNPVVEVTPLECVADTVIAEHHFDFGFLDHWRAIVGAVVAVLILSLVVGILCLCGCITCCCVCAQNGRQKKKLENYEKRSAIALEGSTEPGVAYARRVDPEEAFDPHLVTAKTGTEPNKQTDAGIYS